MNVPDARAVERTARPSRARAPRYMCDEFDEGLVYSMGGASEVSGAGVAPHMMRTIESAASWRGTTRCW